MFEDRDFTIILFRPHLPLSARRSWFVEIGLDGVVRDGNNTLGVTAWDMDLCDDESTFAGVWDIFLLRNQNFLMLGLGLSFLFPFVWSFGWVIDKLAELCTLCRSLESWLVALFGGDDTDCLMAG